MSNQNRLQQQGRAVADRWEPLVPGEAIVSDDLRAQAHRLGVDVDDLAGEIWLNSQYVVVVRRDEAGFVRHLSIRRQDRDAAHDWRDFQQIKNQLAGPDAEAVELYPADERLVDTANQYHLWVYPPGVRIPVGFPVGLVLDAGEGPDIPNAVQRPLGSEDV